jgi:light-regulated signal transduction histidine kinase (bacteriophytochrome)
MNSSINKSPERAGSSTTAETLQNEIARLESANRMLADFAYLVAHDMRGGLRGIGSFAELLLLLPSVSDDPQPFALLQKIITSVRGVQAVMDKSGTPRQDIWKTAHSQRFTPGEETIVRLQRQLSEAQSANGELAETAFSVAHDVRNPLNQILRFAGLLMAVPTINANPVALDLSSQLLAQARKMKGLIDDYLAFFQTERHELKRVRVSLKELVELARHELEGQAAGRKISWEIQPLPEVEGDPAMLRQAILNLLSNSVKFTRTRPEGRITIGIKPDLENCILYIGDNGIGFDSTSAQNLFHKFQRLHSREDFDGTGVGLVVVRHIIQRHGGKVWAEAVPGKGATFYISLPAAKPE